MHAKTTALALGAAVLGGLGFLAYRGMIHVGDRLVVRVGDGGAALGLDPNLQLVMKVTSTSGNSIQGTIEGAMVNGTVTPIPVTNQSFTIAPSSVVQKL